MELAQEVLLAEESLAQQQASNVTDAMNNFLSKRAANRHKQYRRHRTRLTIKWLRAMSKVAKVLKLRTEKQKSSRSKAHPKMLAGFSVAEEYDPIHA